jgi:LAS superfamily LD-carboxypeptidase LdcB
MHCPLVVKISFIVQSKLIFLNARTRSHLKEPNANHMVIVEEKDLDSKREKVSKDVKKREKSSKQMLMLMTTGEESQLTM